MRRDGRDSPSPRRIPSELLDFDNDQVFHFQGAPFTGIAVADEPDGGRSEIRYENGLQEGPARDWYPSRAIKCEAPYRQGVVHGVQRRYREDGSVVSEDICEYGVRVRSLIFDESGHQTETFALTPDSINYQVLRELRSRFGE
jgi:hypothetical protein